MILENSVIGFNHEDSKDTTLKRVLWISTDKKTVVMVDITDKKKKKFPFFCKYEDINDEFDSGYCREIEIDPDLRIISPDENYLERYKEKRDKNWDIIKDIVAREPEIYIPSKRGKLIKEVFENTGKSKKVIYELLKKYWFYGKSKNGLLPDYIDCGAPGKERKIKKKTGPKSEDGNNFIVTDEDKIIFEKSVRKYHIREKMDLTATYDHMCEKYYMQGYYRKYGEIVPIVEPDKAPTLRQFLYWYHKNYSFKEKYSNRHGKRKAAIEARALQGDSTARAPGVGFLYEIDSTPADIILVTEDRKTIIGSPTLYIVKDVFSRMITGFHASLAPPSWIEQMVALENAVSSKVEFCRKYDIDIEEEDWPCQALPQQIVGDRGELKGKKSEQLVSLKIDVLNAPSYRGGLKPFVEQHFRITNKEIRELLSSVGAKPPKMLERGDFDPARNAALTINEFMQFMIIQIITYNKSALNKKYFVTKEMFEDGVTLTPLGIWNWGTRKRLLHKVSRNEIRYNLLPKDTGVVTRSGIIFMGIGYTSDLALKEGWFEIEQIDGNKKVQLVYDPRNVSSVFIRLKNGNLEQLRLTDKYKDYEDLHLEEVKAILKYKKDQLKEQKIKEKQHKSELHAYSKALAQKAKSETLEATKEMSYLSRHKDKRTIKRAESRAIGSKNAWTEIDSSNIEKKERLVTEVIDFPNSQEYETESDSDNKLNSIFSSKRKEREKNLESME